jgi:hypothetical protein
MKKTLLIASSSLLTQKILPRLSAQGENIVHVLVPSEAFRAKLSTLCFAEAMIVPGGQGFRFRGIPAFRALYKETKFDEVICLYNNKTGHGYLNVDLYAWMINAKDRYAYNYDLAIIPLKAGSIVRKIVRYAISPLWLVINTLLLAIVMFLILIAMFVVELFVAVEKSAIK